MNKNDNIINKENLTWEINQVETALGEAYNNLQLVTSSELVDYYAYKIKAEEAKHKYLLNQIKESFEE